VIGTKAYQERMFCNFSLSERVPQDHFLGKVAEAVDLSFCAKVGEASLRLHRATGYRDTIPGFSRSLNYRVGFTTDTAFSDSTAQLWRTYDYLVTTTDFSGNESSPSNEAAGIRYMTGDANADGVIDVGDIVYLINYLFKTEPAPSPLPAGDATCDGNVDVGDIVYLINYLFKGGPPPSC